MALLAVRKIKVHCENRKNERRKLRNRSNKSKMNTYLKKVLTPIQMKKKDDFTQADKDNLKAAYIKFVKCIDKAVTKGVLHKNTAARKKSRIAKKVNNIVLSK